MSDYLGSLCLHHGHSLSSTTAYNLTMWYENPIYKKVAHTGCDAMSRTRPHFLSAYRGEHR
jgi:hypothetical protein